MKFKKIHTIRIKPDQRIPDEILKYCQAEKITSAVILSMLGSLRSIELGFLKKLPGKFITKKFKGPLEIISGTGTIATKENETIIHIHMEISDEKRAIGGHLISGVIFSTAEIIIAELDFQIERYKDNFTGLNELKDN